MDALNLGAFLSPLITVTTVWNIGETGDIYSQRSAPLAGQSEGFTLTTRLNSYYKTCQ